MNAHSVWHEPLDTVKRDSLAFPEAWRGLPPALTGAAVCGQVDSRWARVVRQLSRGLRTEPYQTYRHSPTNSRADTVCDTPTLS